MIAIILLATTCPFATVLKSVGLTIAVSIHVRNINTRLWCVYEMHFAVLKGVPVKLYAYISPEDLKNGRIHEDTCVASAESTNDLKLYDQYLQSEKLDHDNYKNFKAWLTYIQDELILTK